MVHGFGLMICKTMVKKKWAASQFLKEKEMATHSSTLAWKVPWTEESGSPQSLGPPRVGPN